MRKIFKIRYDRYEWWKNRTEGAKVKSIQMKRPKKLTDIIYKHIVIKIGNYTLSQDALGEKK